MKKVVIIGCGAVAYRWYFKGIMNSKVCEIVALVDTNKENLNAAAEYCNVSNTFENVNEFLKSSLKVDIALVLTPHHSHYQIIKLLLTNKINVYSEKPFAENAKEAKELIDLAKSNGLSFCSAPQVMLSSRNKKVKALIEEGTIGDIVMVRASGSNMGPSDREGINYDPEWFYKDGGSLASLGIYTLAIIIFIWGLPKRVAAYSGISIPHRKVMYGPFKGKEFDVSAPDNEVALLDYGKNYVLFDGSYVIKNPVEHELIIHGTEGSLLVGGFGGKSSIVLQKNGEKTEIGPEDDCHINWNLSWGIDEMAIAMNEKREPLTDASFSRDVITVIDAIRESNESNNIVLI